MSKIRLQELRKSNRLILGEPVSELASTADECADLVYVDLSEQRTYLDTSPRQLELFEREKQPPIPPQFDSDVSLGLLRQAHRILSRRGNCYVHCTPLNEHLVRDLLDKTFGSVNFKNQIVWRRVQKSPSPQGPFESVHDIVFLYSKTDSSIAHAVATATIPDSNPQYRHFDSITGRRYSLGDCQSPRPRSFTTFDWNGHTRSWRWTRDEMHRLAEQGRLVYTKSGLPRYKRFLDERRDDKPSSLWIDPGTRDKRPRNARGGPPESFFLKMIEASSDPGGLVVVSSCFDAAAVIAAGRLSRRITGVFRDHLSLAVARAHLRQASADGDALDYCVLGIPRTIAAAQQLARADSFQFACWAVGTLGADPVGLRRQANSGLDGRLTMKTEEGFCRAVLSVRTSKLTANVVDELAQLRISQCADVLILLTLADPGRLLRQAAHSAGTFKTRHGRLDRLQVLSISEVLARIPADGHPMTSDDFPMLRLPPQISAVRTGTRD